MRRVLGGIAAVGWGVAARDADPLADITSVRKVVSTMRAGVLYEAAPLLAALSVKP